jgi:translocator assembly and maintenance protein 41
VETSTSVWRQDKSPEATRARVDALPSTVATMLRGVDADDDAERVGDAVRACLKRIVRASTLRQAVAGLVTTSPMRTLAYVGAKFYKAARSRGTSGAR